MSVYSGMKVIYERKNEKISGFIFFGWVSAVISLSSSVSHSSDQIRYLCFCPQAATSRITEIAVFFFLNGISMFFDNRNPFLIGCSI